jgi:hypothetical protein
MTETTPEPDIAPEDPEQSAGEGQPQPPDEPVSEPDVEGERVSATDPPA